MASGTLTEAFGVQSEVQLAVIHSLSNESSVAQTVVHQEGRVNIVPALWKFHQ